MFFYIVFTPISTTSGLWNAGNTRKYQQIDVYIYQCVPWETIAAFDGHDDDIGIIVVVEVS